MSRPSDCLNEGIVERIFAEMRANYGAAFDRQWECPAGMDPATHARQLKQTWGRELGVFAGNLAAIAHGLKNMPTDHPPNLLQFRAICMRCPPPPAPQLPAPQADPARVAAAIKGVGRLAADPLASYRRLREREMNGERLTEYQRKAWREALARLERQQEPPQEP